MLQVHTFLQEITPTGEQPFSTEDIAQTVVFDLESFSPCSAESTGKLLNGESHNICMQVVTIGIAAFTLILWNERNQHVTPAVHQDTAFRSTPAASSLSTGPAHSNSAVAVMPVSSCHVHITEQQSLAAAIHTHLRLYRLIVTLS